MECDKCKAQIEVNSRFCGKCGNNVKEKEFDLNEGMRTCRKFWYMVGFYRGTCIAEDDMDSLKEFERIIEKAGIIAEYLEAVKFLKDEIKRPIQNDN